MKSKTMFKHVPLCFKTRKFFYLSSLIFALFLLPAISHAAPKIFYTDIISGPNTGGENNNGAYLSIFGKDFGSNINNVRVYVGGGEVVRYMYLGSSLGRPDIQQLSVQLGPNTSTGAIRVVVSGVESNTDHTFTIRSGDIYYVALNGNDSTGVIGNISSPFRSVQNTFNRADFGPGDHIVVRSGTWTDVGLDNSFVSIKYKGGTATDPMVIMAYPGETVSVDHHTGKTAFVLYNTLGGVVISNFLINTNTANGCVDIGMSTQYVRIVNNDVQGMWENSGGNGCISGNGKHYNILGNAVHDNGNSSLYHGIYFDNRDGLGSDDIEIGYNHIYNQTGGRGIQIYHGTTGIGLTNVSVHDNIIHDIALDGIIFGLTSGGGFKAYNNIIYRTGAPLFQTNALAGSCIRFDSADLVAEIYNNTFYDCGMIKNSDAGALRLQTLNQIRFMNNAIVATTGESYYVNYGVTLSNIIASNNLWYGAGNSPTWGNTNAVNLDPLFVNPSAADFTLQSASPAIDTGSSAVAAVVTKDFDGNTRPMGTGYDIGAYEYAGPAVPMLQFSSATYSVSESTATATISVTRIGSSAGAVSVNYATSNGTATSGSDYTSASGTLNWADTDVTTKSFTVSIINDTLVESDETINLTLSNPTGGAILGSQSAAVLTILDDDGPSTLRFENPSYSVSEGAGTATIRVLRTGSSSGAVSVNYATSNGTATAGSDYTAASGTLNWASGDTAAKSFTITIINDTVVESNETVNITLSNQTTGALLGGTNPVVLTITDNDSAGGNTGGSGSGGDASASGGGGCGFVKDDNNGKGPRANGGAATFAMMLIMALAGIAIARKIQVKRRVVLG